MQKIDKLLITAKRETLEDVRQREQKELKQVINRMTTEQLEELVDGNPSDERFREIFASVGGLHLLESG